MRQQTPVFFVGVAGFLAGVFLTLLTISITFSAQPVFCLNGFVQPVFSPGAEDEILSLISSTNSSLDLMLYQFSYSGLKQALVSAAARGARVRLILDPKINANLETASFLSKKGVQVKWGSQEFVYTHAKLAIVDARCVLVGSINWSRHALFFNREAAIILCDSSAVNRFQKVFEDDWQAASPVV